MFSILSVVLSVVIFSVDCDVMTTVGVDSSIVVVRAPVDKVVLGPDNINRSP